MSTDPHSENLRGAIEFGARTIQSLVLVNGGAAISILTFWGNALVRADERSLFDRSSLVWALTMFGLGVAMALLASVLAYLSQLATVTNGKLLHSQESFLRGLAVLAGLGSAVLFTLGVVNAGTAFLR